MSGRADIVLVLFQGLSGGGAERVAATLIECWQARGRRVRFVSLHRLDERSYIDDSTVDHVALDDSWHDGAIERVSTRLLALPRAVRVLWRLRRVVRSSGASSVVAFLPNASLMTIVACAGLRVRVVVSERSDPAHDPHPAVVRAARRLLYRFADVVTANSASALDAMRRYVPHARLALVHNPVAIPETTARPESSRTVLMVGRLVELKRHDLAVEAFAAAQERLPGWRLRLLGDGPLAGQLRDRAEALGLADRVRLDGFVAETGEAYADAAGFLLTSRFEGTPNALLEAMAHGLPCVVPDDVPAVADLVVHGVTGLVYRGGDAAALAEALADLAGDADRRARLGHAARGRVKAAYEPDRVVDAWDELLASGG